MNNILNSTGINILQDTNSFQTSNGKTIQYSFHVKELKNEEDIANFKEIIIKDKEEK